MGSPIPRRLGSGLVLFALVVPVAAAFVLAPSPGIARDVAFDAIPARHAPLLSLQAQPVDLAIDADLALAGEIQGFLQSLGFAGDPTDAVRQAGLDPAVASALASTLAALHACHEATLAALAVVPLADVGAAVRSRTAIDPAPFAGIGACALPAAQAIVDLQGVLAEKGSASALVCGPPDLDVWPVIIVDTCGNDVYENDYILVVDTAGDDIHDNNAGSNMIDTRFAPASSAVPGVDTIPHVPGFNDGDDDRSGFGPSEGCAIALGSMLAGNCTPVAAALVDTAGNDQYGVFKSPVAGIDARCTSDPVIRRMVTNGVGFLGFGMLLDTTGDDAFFGRTGANGSGHIFGVGVLWDRAGNDHYLDVRNGQGFSLIGDLGLLLDEAGNDVYDMYMPSALVPGTPNEQDGAGGVIDDTNLCDNLPRFLQGAGDAVGVGILLDLDGNDAYTAGCTPTFGAPGNIGAPACGQGFGATGGIGILVDRGNDVDTHTGVPGRANGLTLVNVDIDATASAGPGGASGDATVSQETFSDG